MQALSSSLWMPRLAALLSAALLVGSVVVWVLHWPQPSRGGALPLATPQDAPPTADAAALARLLGADVAPAVAAAAVDASSRFRLTGVIASGSGQGVALLSIDGQPPKPYRVGSVLENGLMLQSVESRRVALASDAHAPVRLRLELPPKQ